MNSYKHTARFALLFIVVLLILIDGIYGSGIFPTLLTGLASLVGIESQGSATFASDLAVEGEVVVPWSADICADCEVRSVRLSGFIDANASGNAVVFLETKKSSLLIFNQTVLLKPIDRGVSAQEQPGVFYFNLRCTDTCVLPESVKEGSLRFQVDSNISLRVTSITYEWAQNPEKDAGEVIPEVPEIQPLEAEALNEPAPEKGVIEPVKTPVNASLEQPALVVNETTGTSKKEGKNVSSAVVKTPRGKVIKVTVSNAPNARKVLAATEIPEVEQSRIALYRTTGGVRETVEFLGYDTNGNELIDRVEWSSVSGTETYEIIIEISAAEHLDAQRGFISDIYDEVNAQDGVWSEEIPDGDFVRVAFEKNLTAARDITIYPRVTSGSPRIEVYEVNGTAKIAEFSSIVSNQYMKVYLAGLDGKQDTFDLRVFDGSVEFDHIIDPEQFFYDNFESGDFAGWDISGLLDFWTLDTVVAIDTTSAKCAAQKNCNNFGMATTGAIDTSAATGVNLTLRFNDDDLDATGDAEVYFLNSTISWVLVGNLNAVTEDTWETFTFTSTNASYLHSGFDNVNITALTGSSCPSTLTQNTTLIGDMFAPASCFLFGADNIVLDCNGRSIAWDNAGGGNDFAVWSDNRSNVTVKNCVLIDGNVGGAFSVGINFTRTNNSLVENNTVRTNGTNNNYGIVLQTSAFNNSVLNNTVQANGTAGSNVGIYLFSTVSGNNVSRNNITTNGTSSNQGIRLELSATNNGVFNNTVLTNGTSSGNNGVYLFSTVSNNTVSGNVIVTNGSDNNHGLRLETSANNNTFHDNFITTLANQSYGISL
ncbi:right-handed parallel beta-helix repeat-containing protein, partial [Candidatus Woesearchaeota archaeon]|nr:right-handed parallel beta-helix repeat-containing protein [Candidatus Woesearchaeota archaeon]